MKKILVALVAASALVLSGCSTDADTARHNLDIAAEQFEVERHIVFINGITDNYLLEVLGRCSYEVESDQVVLICKTGPNDSDVWKHSMVRSDNVTVVVEQLSGVDVDEYRHRVIFKPEQLIPDIDLETSRDIERDG